MEHTFHLSKWKWEKFDVKNEEQAKKLVQKHHSCETWIENIKQNKANLLNMYTGMPNQEMMWGSLVYKQDVEEKNQTSVFHFFLTREELITANLDLSELENVNIKAVKGKMHDSETAVEGFFVLVGEVLNQLSIQIDQFEVKLRDLLWQIKERNSTGILEKVANAEHELLVRKNLVVPMLEIRMAAEEVFGDEIMEGKQYKRAKRRMKRIRILIRDYEDEIKSLLGLESVVSTHRGNEIMKTLTVLTTLFTPITALGAIWGMNFEHMPELKWKFGYLFSGAVIFLTTFTLYLYLKKKGWTGDILTGRSKKSFFK